MSLKSGRSFIDLVQVSESRHRWPPAVCSVVFFLLSFVKLPVEFRLSGSSFPTKTLQRHVAEMYPEMFVFVAPVDHSGMCLIRRKFASDPECLFVCHRPVSSTHTCESDVRIYMLAFCCELCDWYKAPAARASASLIQTELECSAGRFDRGTPFRLASPVFVRIAFSQRSARTRCSQCSAGDMQFTDSIRHHVWRFCLVK